MPPISASFTSKSPYADQSTAASTSNPKRVASSTDANLPPASEKPYKPAKTKWEQRMRERNNRSAMKAMEQEMAAERTAEREAHAARIKERRQKAANKARIEELSKKMSGKRLERQKRRMGLTKKIAH